MPYLGNMVFKLVRILILISLLVYANSNMYAQEDDYTFTYYGLDEGLPHLHVASVVAHSDGFYYVGTRSGLARFDGYTFHKVSIPLIPEAMYGELGPFIVKLDEMEEGNILITYQTTNKIRKKTGSVFNPNTLATKDSLFEDIVIKPSQYFTTVLEYDAQDSSKHKITYSDNHGNRIVLTRTNFITDKAVLMANNGQIIDFSPLCKSMEYITGITGFNFSKSFFISSVNGLFKVDPILDLFPKYLYEQDVSWKFGKKIRALAFIDSTHLLVSSEDDPLVKIDLVSNQTQIIYAVDEQTLQPYNTKYCTAINIVSDTLAWITSYEYSVGLLNLRTNIIKKVDSLDAYLNYHSILLDNGHLLNFSKSKIGGRHNLSWIDLKGNVYKHIKLSKGESIIDVQVNSAFLLKRSNGMIWIGLDDGIIVIDPIKEEVICNYVPKSDKGRCQDMHHPCHPILESGAVLSLEELDNGEIWAGMGLTGITIIDPIKHTVVAQFDEESDLRHNAVPSIIAHDNQVWIATFNGLNQFDIDADHMFDYSTKDGLSHNEFNRMSAAKSENGMIAFGSMNGLIAFDPEVIRHQLSTREMILSELNYFSAYGSPIKQVFNLDNIKSLTIPSNYRSCSFKVSLKTIDVNERLRYSYKLVPKADVNTKEEVPWNQNGNNREISFDYLPSGNYELYIRAQSSDSSLSQPFHISLHVKDYFYKTWWFLLSCIGLISLFFYILYRYRVQQIIRTEKLKTQLSSNLHDDVGSVLSGVAYQMELLEYSVDEANRPLVQQIAVLSRRAMQQMRDVVWAINSRNAMGIDFVERLNDIAEELLTPLNIDWQIISDQAFNQIELSSDMRHDLLLICKEFIANTIKHSGANQLKISIAKNKKEIKLTLSDNGKGMAQAIQNSGQGLQNIQHRVKKHKGQFNIDSDNGLTIEVVMQV